MRTSHRRFRADALSFQCKHASKVDVIFCPLTQLVAQELEGCAGFSYDWDRELSTTDPEYYKWTQWIFVQLFKRGLAYQAEVPVNWCPALGTVLSNEEVIDGKSERGDHPVIRQPMKQVQPALLALMNTWWFTLAGMPFTSRLNVPLQWAMPFFSSPHQGTMAFSKAVIDAIRLCM